MSTDYIGKRRGKHVYYTHTDDPVVGTLEWAFREADRHMEARVSYVLDSAYPGYEWRVQCRHAQGVLYISLPTFTDWGLCVKLIDLKGDPMLKKARMMAGEYLEGLKLPRKEVDEDTIRAAVAERMPVLTRGLKPYA